jgi:hypothetical protein
MTCLPVFFSSGGFGELGLAAITKLFGKTGDGSILYRLLFKSDVPALRSLAQVYFKFLTPLMSS